jgi:hypothetical protein
MKLDRLPFASLRVKGRATQEDIAGFSAAAQTFWLDALGLNRQLKVRAGRGATYAETRD